MGLSRKPAPGAGKRKGGTKRRVVLLKKSSTEQTVQGPIWWSLRPPTFSRHGSDYPMGPLCCCSVTKSCPTLCDPMDCSMPGFPVLHHLPEFAEIHIHRVSDAIQPSHPLLSPSPPAFSLSQHQGLFQWVDSSHQMDKVLQLQLQYQFFQRIFRVEWAPDTSRNWAKVRERCLGINQAGVVSSPSNIHVP